jgi:hypothetical protein
VGFLSKLNAYVIDNFFNGRDDPQSKSVGQRGAKSGECGMKWYYKWKLKKIQKEINQLQELSRYTLIEDYTPNSRLRILDRMEKHLQQQLAQTSSPSTQN